jgi:SAM-dependent methyltransferase
MSENMSPVAQRAIPDQYTDYYVSEDPEWRRLGAVDKAANIVALCTSHPHESILEVGAGDGAILERLSEIGFGERLYATEISSSGLARISAKHIPRLVEARALNGYELPFADKDFDLVVLSHVLEHVEHPRLMLDEAARVARLVFVEVPLEDISRASRDFVADRVGHINFYSPRTIRWLVQSCNLRVARQAVTNPSKATYTYGLGSRGAVHYFVKQTLLRAIPSLAVKYFSYHASLLCEPTSAQFQRSVESSQMIVQ